MDIRHHESAITVKDEAYYRNEKNFCYSCARAKDSTFELVPWDTAHLWCENCLKRYLVSEMICLNPICREIPSKEEAKEIRNAESPHCSTCNSEVRDDYATTKKRRKISGECANCGPAESYEWHKVPWNRRLEIKICKSCRHVYFKYKGHCRKCNKIFTKNELEDLRVKYEDNTDLASCTRCKEPIILPPRDHN